MLNELTVGTGRTINLPPRPPETQAYRPDRATGVLIREGEEVYVRREQLIQRLILFAGEQNLAHETMSKGDRKVLESVKSTIQALRYRQNATIAYAKGRYKDDPTDGWSAAALSREWAGRYQNPALSELADPSFELPTYAKVQQTLYLLEELGIFDRDNQNLHIDDLAATMSLLTEDIRQRIQLRKIDPRNPVVTATRPLKGALAHVGVELKLHARIGWDLDPPTLDAIGDSLFSVVINPAGYVHDPSAEQLLVDSDGRFTLSSNDDVTEMVTKPDSYPRGNGNKESVRRRNIGYVLYVGAGGGTIPSDVVSPGTKPRTEVFVGALTAQDICEGRSVLPDLEAFRDYESAAKEN